MLAFVNKYCNIFLWIFVSFERKIIRNDTNNLFFYEGIEAKPIYILYIIRLADYTVCKSLLLLYLDRKINY